MTLLGALAIVFLLKSGVAACFPAEAGLSEFHTEWFCKQLAAAREHQLSGDPAFRFSYVPSFHHARVVTIVVENGQPFVIGKVLTGKGGYEPGKLGQTTRRKLTPQEWRLVQKTLVDTVWDKRPAPPRVVKDKDGRVYIEETVINDGDEWILEKRQHGNYRIRVEHSPSGHDDQDFRAACIYMLELAGIKPRKEELY